MGGSHMGLHTPMSLRYGMDLRETRYRAHQTQMGSVYHQRHRRQANSVTPSWEDSSLLRTKARAPTARSYAPVEKNQEPVAKEGKPHVCPELSPKTVQIPQKKCCEIQLPDEPRKKSKEQKAKKWRRFVSCFTGGVDDSPKDEEDETVDNKQTD